MKTDLVVVIVCIVLMGLAACQPATPAPVTLTVTPAKPLASLTTIPPTPTLTLTPTSTPTPSPTPTPTPTLPPTPLPASDAVLTRGPYLQSVTANSIIVVWETDEPSRGEVVYGEIGEYGSSAVDPEVSTRHAITLTGLVPYTTYHYRVANSGISLSDDATFRTAAGPNQTTFTFVAFGDTRTQHQIHRQVVQRIAAVEPDFVLHTGDLVAMGSATHQWRNFFEIEQELVARAPLFPTLGNHEGANPRYFDLFYLPGNERWYTFDYGHARFICLQVDRFADYEPGSEQYAWLEETLAANTQPWLFVYFHLPPYTSIEDDDEADVRQVLPQLFEQYGVDVVFNGHAHSYERHEMHGITYVVTAGGGAPLYSMEEQEPTQLAFSREYHFTILEIDGDRLKATAVSIGGEVLDEFEQSAN